LDKTLEIIIAASVILLTAGVVMFMVGGQSGDFQNWLNDTQGDAECSLMKTEFENACSNSPDTAPDIRAEAQSKSCEWAETTTGCPN